MEHSTQQIGKCGELLVQYRLLTWGIETSSLTTDTGVDLVAFDEAGQKIVKIQVKASQIKEDSWVGWSVEKKTSVDYIACVDITRERFWLIEKKEFVDKAISAGQNWSLWWYLPGQRGEKARAHVEEEFAEDESEKAIPRIFKGAKRIPMRN